MNLFELYKIINENLQQKSNLLATVLEGEVAGSRYFWTDGELLGYTGTGEVNEELKTQITETPQSGIYEIEGQKFFIEHLKRQAHLVIWRRACITAGDQTRRESRISCDSSGRQTIFCGPRERSRSRPCSLRCLRKKPAGNRRNAGYLFSGGDQRTSF